jgi:hypothetical protein
MNVNIEKRLKKFNKNFSFYKNHPNFEDIKTLYINDIIKNINSVDKAFRKIKITKKGKLYKTSEESQKKIIEKVKILNGVDKLENNYIISRKIKLDYNKIYKEGYGFITNKIEFDKIRKQAPDCYYVQVVEFFDDNNNLLNKDSLIKSYKTIKNDKDKYIKVEIMTEQKIFYTRIFELIYENNNKYKKFIESININMSPINYEYLPKTLIGNDYEDRRRNYYTIITTTAYKKQLKNEKIKLNQIYRNDDNGTCVYNAFLKYFESRLYNKHAKSTYNKLLKNDDLKKSYTDETINEISSFCNATLKIKDIVNNKDKIFKNDYSRFYIELINTKYNHLDLLKSDYEDVVEVDNIIELEKIKDSHLFYIEKCGLVITTDKTYKIKDNNFKIIYSEWKKQINYKKYFIECNSDDYKLISHYDYAIHTFFNNFKVDNELYYELDLVKAYYNYSNKDINKHYNGVPSGSFINLKCNDNFTIDLFNEMNNNNLIGYFEICIINIKSHFEHFEKFGLIVNSFHILTSCQINLLKDYIDFKFINASYCPSVHIPFNNNFLQKDENNIKYYCRAFGLMLCNASDIDMTIKTLYEDKKYYIRDENYINTIDSDIYDIYFVNNLIKVSSKNKVKKSYCHIAYYIHSYTRTLILEQLLKIDINKVFGVKLDSIIIKKDYIFDYNKKLFGDNFKVCNIESMLKTNDDENEYASEYYRNYFCKLIKNVSDVLDESVNFNESFLYTGDIIKNRVLFIGGAGGSGKTSSLLSSLPNKYSVYSSSCWNLIQGQKSKYSNLMGFSLPNLTGKCGTFKTEKAIIPNCKYLIIDELTLINYKDIETIINDINYKNSFIFLLGDIDYKGFYYQCSLPSIKVIKPINYNFQYVYYNKTFRFNNELFNILKKLRYYMINYNNSKDKLNIIKNKVKKYFKNCFYNKEDIIFNNDDIGISDINDFENNDNELTNYFINKGTQPQYFIKTTNKNNGQLKGQKLSEIPNHNNYECKLFKTIHSFQGLDLNENNKIIISISKNFDYNLFYTALSRARRLDQIIIINN